MLLHLCYYNESITKVACYNFPNYLSTPTSHRFLWFINSLKQLLFLLWCVSSCLAHQFCLSVNLQKLTSDLAGVEQQKKVLELELEQWRQITFPQQTFPVPTAPVNAECSCQGKTMPASPDPALQALESEVKQLQAKLKVSNFTVQFNSTKDTEFALFYYS